VSTIEQLLVVQEHDTRILQLGREIRDIPERQAKELERLNGHKAALAEAEAAFKLKLSALKQFEVETGAKREKIAKLRGQQMDLKTNKEFKAMDHEILAIEESIKATEDSEIVVMEAIEAARGSVEQSRKDLEAEDAEVQADIKALDARMAGLQAELNDEAVARKAAAEGIDAEWLARYEGIFKSKGGRALVSTEGAVCGGCHMTLPPYLQHDARKRLEMVVCGFCGRLLY